MSCVDDLLITLSYDDHVERQYYSPDDTLRGVATLHLRSPMRVRTVAMFVSGAATVSWEDPNHKKIYSDREEYLQGSQSLLDAGQDNAVVLGVGSHEFSFCYKLPENLPSSFSGVYGSVTYLVKVAVEGEDERDTTVSSEPFLFLRRPPLTTEDYADVKLTQKKYFLTGCSIGQVAMEVSLNQTGAVPGMSFLVNAEVRNWSSKGINMLHGALICQSVYYCRRKNKKVVFRQIINKRVDNYNFFNRHGRRWRNVIVSLPPYIPESDLNYCNIMDVTYFFQYRAFIGRNIDLMVETPIRVGGFPEGARPLGSVANSQQHTLREWGVMAGRYSMTESVDGDAFDLS